MWTLPVDGHQTILIKMETFLKVFEKIDAKVVIQPTNMIIGRSNIMNYEYDNAIPISRLCENIEAYLIWYFLKSGMWHVKNH